MAVAKQAGDDGIAPGMMEMKSIIKKKNGTVVHRETITFKINATGAEEDMEVISAVSDGKDVTEKTRAENARDREKTKEPKEKADDGEQTLDLSPFYHPFDPKVQNRVTFKRLKTRMVKGKRVVVFSFTHSVEKGKKSLVGTAWLDGETGVPLQVEVSPRPLPDHVSKMMTRVHFQLTPEGWWVPVRSEILGEGGMLWIRRLFENRFRFWDFKKTP